MKCKGDYATKGLASRLAASPTVDKYFSVLTRAQSLYSTVLYSTHSRLFFSSGSGLIIQYSTLPPIRLSTYNRNNYDFFHFTRFILNTST